MVGITGDSGSGKNTLLDIMIGLLKPVKGEIYLDDKYYTNSLQNICGYVSQNLFFYNDTFAKNIAFGGLMRILIKNKYIIVLKFVNWKIF